VRGLIVDLERVVVIEQVRIESLNLTRRLYYDRIQQGVWGATSQPRL
jgi:hypothetical protein